MAASLRDRNWVFTLNNPPDDFKINESDCKYAVWQLERGEGGTPHIQGYIEFKNKKSMAQVKRIISDRAHVERRRGTGKQARDYCMKEETRVGGPPVEVGIFVGQGRSKDYVVALRELEENGGRISSVMEKHAGVVLRYPKGIRMYASHFAKKARLAQPAFIAPRITVLFGQSGAGKTRHAYEIDRNLFSLSRTKDTIWWDGYDGQETVLIDEFYGWIKYSEFLRYLDGYQIQGQVKGAFVELYVKHWIICSNDHPKSWYGKNASFCVCALYRRLTEFGVMWEYFQRNPGSDEPLFDRKELDHLICNKHDNIYRKGKILAPEALYSAPASPAPLVVLSEEQVKASETSKKFSEYMSDSSTESEEAWNPFGLIDDFTEKEKKEFK